MLDKGIKILNWLNDHKQQIISTVIVIVLVLSYIELFILLQLIFSAVDGTTRKIIIATTLWATTGAYVLANEIRQGFQSDLGYSSRSLFSLQEKKQIDENFCLVIGKHNNE